jgi:hypothetical protein
VRIAARRRVPSAVRPRIGLGATKETVMYRHVVMFAFRDDVTPEQKQGILDGLAKLPPAIDVVRSYSFGPDAGRVADNFEVVVVADFDTPDDFDTYFAHEAHQEFLGQLVPLLATRSAVQYET